MIVGFTGTRRGMTDAQMCTVARALQVSWCPDTVSHGCAVGADRQFHALALSMPHVRFILRPSTPEQSDWGWKLYWGGDSRIEHMYRHEPPLERNKRIVRESQVLLACPAMMTEELRSGTWATIRYARKEKRSVVICWPDGSKTYER